MTKKQTILIFAILVIIIFSLGKIALAAEDTPYTGSAPEFAPAPPVQDNSGLNGAAEFAPSPPDTWTNSTSPTGNTNPSSSGAGSWLNMFSGGGGSSGGGLGIVPRSTFGLPTGTPFSIVSNILGLLLGLFGILGLIGFVISGIMYLISSGSTEVMEKAKKGMIYSIIGIVVGLSGYIIIYTVDYFLRSY